MSQLQYEPLSRTQDEIRILDLLPGSGPISCRLRNVKLSDSPQFEALSYFWGTSAKKKTVSVNGHPFNIGNNLHLALRYLRGTHGHRTLWIDAICINQDDYDEQNIQVPLMLKIYEQSWSVTIWLGCSNFLNRRAMRVLRVLLEFSHIWPLGDSRVTTDVWRNAEFNLGQTTGRSARGDRDLRRNWFWDRVLDSLAFDHFWKNAWFTRVWILQEAAVCRKTVLKCGHDEIDWPRLMHYRNWHPEFIPYDAIGPLTARLGRERDVPVDLFTAFAMNEEARATNNRDKIYGVLAPVKDDNSIGIKVDYSQKVSDAKVFIDFTRAILKNRNDLDVLVRCRGDRPFPSHKNLPSWSLCWDCDETQAFYSLSFSAHSKGRDPKPPGPKNVCATEFSKPQVAFSDDGMILRLMGAYFDEVEIVGTAMPRAEVWFSTDTISAYLSWREICNIDSDDLYHSTGESQREVLWKIYEWFDAICRSYENRTFEEFDKTVVVLTRLLPSYPFGMAIGIFIATVWDVLMVLISSAGLCSSPTWLSEYTGGCGRRMLRTYADILA